MIAPAQPSLTPQAQKLWDLVPAEAQERILSNCFCTRCAKAVRMIQVTGTVVRGDVRLQGACNKCGHTVVRTVETSGR